MNIPWGSGITINLVFSSLVAAKSDNHLNVGNPRCRSKQRHFFPQGVTRYVCGVASQDEKHIRAAQIMLIFFTLFSDLCFFCDTFTSPELPSLAELLAAQWHIHTLCFTDPRKSDKSVLNRINGGEWCKHLWKHSAISMLSCSTLHANNEHSASGSP